MSTVEVGHAAAVAAAEWWARYVEGYVGSTKAGLGSEQGMTAILGGLLQAKNATVNPVEKVDQFKASLIEFIKRSWETSLKINPHYDPSATISTDYGPGYGLGQAIDASGVRGSWPWKTIMHVGRDYVSVGEGYGARLLPIYGEKACNYCSYAIERDSPVDSEPTGFEIDYNEADWTNGYPDGLGYYKVRITETPCSACGGTKILKPREVARNG